MNQFRGFTLFEVLLALTITSIGMLALYKLQHMTWSLLMDSQEPAYVSTIIQ